MSHLTKVLKIVFNTSWTTTQYLASLKVLDTFAIILSCPDVNKPISIDSRSMDYKSKSMIDMPDPRINQFDLTPCIRICVLAMSVSIGRRLAFSRSYDSDSHNCLEAHGTVKTEEVTERLSSNLMAEFRSSSFDYVLIGALQESRQLYDYVLSSL